MEHFLNTVETIPDGLGFHSFDLTHIGWLCALAVAVLLNCFLFKKLTEHQAAIWKKIVAFLILLDEVFKVSMLVLGGNYSVSYLPLHLCSINIFVILLHAFKPSKLVDNFLYTVCIPGALAALLFPTWTELPIGNFMHIHSFTVHILLAMYPLVLAISGKLQISWRMIPKCLGLLLIMAVPIYLVNMLLDTNFMFLMEADAGNPLYWFGQNWGNHLYGFPVLISAILVVMYLPLELIRLLRKKYTAV